MKHIFALGIIFSLIYSCTYDVEEELYPVNTCDLSNITYTLDIAPLIDLRCGPCHDDASNPLGAGIALMPYNELKPFADGGTLTCVINHESTCSPMPKSAGKLPDCEISKIETWIADGALNN